MSQPYTVYLFRSGRIWVQEGTHIAHTYDTDPPLIVENVVASTEYAAIGHVLLKYVDRANQPNQHVCACDEWCCTEICQYCHQTLTTHSPYMLQCNDDSTHTWEIHD